jgi:hypothetical protein
METRGLTDSTCPNRANVLLNMQFGRDFGIFDEIWNISLNSDFGPERGIETQDPMSHGFRRRNMSGFLFVLEEIKTGLCFANLFIMSSGIMSWATNKEQFM